MLLAMGHCALGTATVTDHSKLFDCLANETISRVGSMHEARMYLVYSYLTLRDIEGRDTVEKREIAICFAVKNS